MQITQQDYKHCTLLKPTGRIDSDTAPALEEKLEGLFNDKNHHIVIDLSGVDFISSAGLRVLITGRKTARAARGDVRLAGITDRVKSTFELVGFDKLFQIFDKEVDAVGSF